MTNLDNTNALILVFALPGCGACHEYIPRLIKQVHGFQQFGHPFVMYTTGYELKPGEIPVLIYDSGSDDSELQALLDQHQVENLPTTILMTRRAGSAREEGALDQAKIYQILVTALEHNQ